MSIPTYGQGLTHPRHLAFEPSTGCLFVAEDSTKEVWCFSRHQGQPYQRIACGLANPIGVAFGKAGDLLVTDCADGVVLQIVDGEARPVICGLKNPHGVAVDADGHVIVADTGNEVVKVFDCDNDYALKHEFQVGFRPVDVALQSSGRLVVVSYSGELVVFDPETGERLYHHDAKYATSVGLAVDADDRIYVTQHNHQRLVVFDPELNLLGPVDGLPPLTMAWGLKAVGGGNRVVLYVAEQGRVSAFPIEFRPCLKKDE